MKQPELASFVPWLVARRLLERPDPPSAPEGERFDAAALFADICGFTALAERPARTGPSGVEALSELLNGCFGELVAAHRGDVVKFAGDALLGCRPTPRPAGAAP
jgi:class 3 adenylate cyclase